MDMALSTWLTQLYITCCAGAEETGRPAASGPREEALRPRQIRAHPGPGERRFHGEINQP